MMGLIKPRYSTICVIIICLFLTVQMAQAQFRQHNLGDFRMKHYQGESLNTNDDNPTGEWPQDVYWSSQITFINIGVHVGTWVDNEAVPATHSREGSWYGAWEGIEPYTIKEYRRVVPPEVEVFEGGQWQTSSRRYEGEIDPTLPCDIKIVNRFKYPPGLDVIRRSYSFSNPNHNDYVIFESVYTFTGDHDDDPELEVDVTQGLQDVYFVIGYNMQTAAGTWISFSRWYEEPFDEWTDYESYPSQLVPGGRNLEIVYTWDSDDGNWTEFVEGDLGGPNGNFDDTGDPRWAIGEGGTSSMPSGEFVSPAYIGFALLHADQSVSDKNDDITQPLSIILSTNVYHMWDDAFPGYNTPFDWAASGTRATVDQTEGWPDDPGALEGDYPFQSVGPYNFALGDSVKIVHVVGVNGVSRALSIQKGLEWRSWYRGEGGSFDDDAKNALLAEGKDSLFQTLDRALWAWNRGLDIPDPPRSPNLAVQSGPNEIYLDWEDLAGEGDFDTGTPDVSAYRIYRKKGSFLVDTDVELRADGTHLVWELLDEVPSSQTTYTDVDVVRGEAYHYGVTAVDDGSQNANGIFPGQRLESSKYANRSEIEAVAFEPGAPDAKDVLIVPNPFISGAEDFNFAGARANTILFVNLPPYCTLKIYTVTGDLIKTIEHVSGSADDEWNLITESNQFVASGVYILTVTNAENLARESIDGTIEKFVVIR
jgi:hypothetical protein